MCDMFSVCTSGVTVSAEAIVGGLGAVVGAASVLIADGCNVRVLACGRQGTRVCDWCWCDQSLHSHVERTLLGAGESLLTTSTGGSSRCGIPYRSIDATIALARASERLVDDFGGRSGFPVRVELWVVA